jgi:hypothetical protein
LVKRAANAWPRDLVPAFPPRRACDRRPEDADSVEVGPLLEKVSGPLASVTADGAYDQDGVYAEVGSVTTLPSAVQLNGQFIATLALRRIRMLLSQGQSETATRETPFIFRRFNSVLVHMRHNCFQC